MSPARTHNSRRDSLRRRKPGFLFTCFLVVTFLLLAVGAAAKIYQSWQNKVWIEGARISVVIPLADPTVYSYDPQNQTVTSFSIPKTTEITLAGEYGNWPAGSAWQLGVNENKAWLLSASIQKSLGLPVDAWVGQVGIFDKAPLSFLLEGKTNLTFFDRLRLVAAVGKVGRLGRNQLDLVKLGVLKKTELADGQDGYIVVSEKIESVLDVLRDDRIFAEGKTVRIVNASGKSGLGAQGKRTATLLGLRVIGVDTGRQAFGGVCRLSAKQAATGLVYRRLMQVFGCEPSGQLPQGPADFEITIGEEFAKRW